MPELRPRVCQKSAVLGPARFQDAIWKCFKCQRNMTPLSCFHFLFSCSSFSLVSLRSPRFPLGAVHPAQRPMSAQGRLCLHTAAALAECLFSLPPFGLPDLSFQYAAVAHAQPSLCLLSCHDIEQLPVLRASYAHGSSTLFLDMDTGHMARVGHSVLGSP